MTTENKENTEQKKVGRPSKISKFIEAANLVFEEEKNTVFIYTDEELLFLVNEKLDPEDQITQRTFERWKALLKEDKLEELPYEFILFCRLIKKALIAEKKNIMGAFATEKMQWTKWAWIMERKFKDWNLNAINDFSDKLADNKVEFVLSEFNPETENENQLADEQETASGVRLSQ